MNKKPIKKSPLVNVACLYDRWPKADAQLWVREALEAAVPFFDEDFEHCEMSVVFSSDAHVHELNHTFRQKDKATNVLSFEGKWDENGGEIGDIILAYETVFEEAVEEGLTLREHTIHLIVHGFLHLMGYDHQNDEDADEMESFEAEILHTLGIRNPYAEDA